MQDADAAKILFIAGFGPVVRDAAPSRKLYASDLGLAFNEETGGYLHTEALQGAKTFALWPLSQAAVPCFGKDSWPSDIPVPKHGLSSRRTTLSTPPLRSNAAATGCSSVSGRNLGAKRSAA